MPANLEFSSTLRHITPAFWGALRNDQSFDEFCIGEEGQDCDVQTSTEEADEAGLARRQKTYLITSRTNPIPIWLRPAMKESHLQFYVEQQWWRQPRRP